MNYERRMKGQTIRLLLRSLPIILLIALSAYAGKGLFRNQFWSTHDSVDHISRSFDAVQTFAEGQFPLRWAGTLNYNCGVPVFNFFYPLLYYLVVLVNFFVSDVILSLKLINFASFFVGTIFFYFWMKEEIKESWAAVGGAILYLFAPYRFSLIFVRGSPEYVAYAIFPISMLFYAKALKAKSPKKFTAFLFAATATTGLLTISHNFTVMFLMPIILLYLVSKLLGNRKVGGMRVKLILFSFISAFGLGAFFIIPAFLEERFTQLSIPRFSYTDHFPALWQLIRSPWGYGFSNKGVEDDAMSFALGYAQWLVLGIVTVWLIFVICRALHRKGLFRKVLRKHAWVLGIYFLVLFTIFLILSPSQFVWALAPIIQRIQFPWRFLGIAVLGISVLFVFWVVRFKKHPLVYKGSILLISLLAIYGNHSHLLPKDIFPSEVPLYQEYDRLHYMRHASTTFTNDLLPKDAVNGDCKYETPVVTTEKGERVDYQEESRGSTYGSVKVNRTAINSTGKKVVLNLSYYPDAFELVVNGEQIAYESCDGRVCFSKEILTNGENQIKWHVIQTHIQRRSNIVSLAFLLLWVVIFVAEFV